MVIIRIILLAVLTVGTLAPRSTDYLTVSLTILKTALLIRVGCGLHIILHQMMLISPKISNIHAIIFYNDSFSLACLKFLSIPLILLLPPHTTEISLSLLSLQNTSPALVG